MALSPSSSRASSVSLLQLKVIADTSTLSTGDGQLIVAVPAALTGLVLTTVAAYVSTASSSGLPTVQLRNVTQAADMLSTRVTIDANELTSYTAVTPAVVDPAHAAVVTGDLLAVDVDVAGTGAKGLGLLLTFG